MLFLHFQISRLRKLLISAFDLSIFSHISFIIELCTNSMPDNTDPTGIATMPDNTDTTTIAATATTASATTASATTASAAAAPAPAAAHAAPMSSGILHSA